MRAMILAAGRGERLRPLTDTCPKPLIKVGGNPLILWHIEKLKAQGITRFVVNSAHLSELIVEYLGDGHKFGVEIIHSVEGLGGLETAGGIIKALPYLGDDEFLVVNGDIFIDGDYSQFLVKIPKDKMAHLFLTANPAHNLKGDFSLRDDHRVVMGKDYTFSGVALYKVQAFKDCKTQRLPLRPFFERWALNAQLSGQVLDGKWFDVGTVERLREVNAYLGEKH